VRRSAWRSYLPFLFVLVTITLLVLNEAGLLGPFESALQYVVAPLQRGVATFVEGTGTLFRGLQDVRELQEQVELLRQQVDALTIENIRLQEFEAEASQLRALLNFSAQNPTYAVLGADVVGREACADAPCAEVIGAEPNPYLRYLSVNAGSEEGVAVGMPVVTGGAVLVGRAAEVGPHTTRIQLLTDVGSAVAVRLQHSRATGLVVGQPDGSLRMIYIPQEDEIQVGDIALTSGLAGFLPRGLVLGQVTEVYRLDVELFQEAVVRPAVDYRALELVLFVTSFQPMVEEEPEPGEQP